jgi:hypothetical protein
MLLLVVSALFTTGKSQKGSKSSAPNPNVRIPKSVERMLSYGRVDSRNSELLWWKDDDEQMLMFMLPVSTVYFNVDVYHIFAVVLSHFVAILLWMHSRAIPPSVYFARTHYYYN